MRQVRQQYGLCLALAGLLAAAPTMAEELILVPDSAADRVVALDPFDGSVVDANFIPDPGTVGGINIFNRPLNAIGSPNGTIYVADQFSDLVAEFSAEGEFIRVFSNEGAVDAGTMNNIRGIDVLPNGQVLVSNSGSTSAFALSVSNIMRLGAEAGEFLDDFAFIRYGGIEGPFDVLVLDDRVLVANESKDNLLEFTLGGDFVRVFADEGIDFPQQINATTNGTILMANFSVGDIREYDMSGTLVGVFDPLNLSGYRGVIELGNGQILCTSSTGLQRFTRGDFNFTQILSGSEFRYLERVVLPDIDAPRSAKSSASTDADGDQIAPAIADVLDPTPVLAALAATAERGMRAADVVDATSRLDSPRLAAGFTRTAEIPGVNPVAAASKGLRSANRLVYLIEDSGFFNAPGVTPGRMGVASVTDPGSVTQGGVAESFPGRWGGLDFRSDDSSELFGFENYTNSVRALDFGSNGSTLLESVGYHSSGGTGFTFNLDHTRMYTAGISGSVFRILESDAYTGDVLNVWRYLNFAVSSLAVVPAGTDLPYPPGQLWGMYTQAIDEPLRELHLVQLDPSNGAVISDRVVSGVPFQPEFETGLDWAPDGTLYAAVQGYSVVSIVPPVAEEVSSHLFVIDPVSATATDLGVFQADQTWDAAGIAVVDVPPGDIDGDGDVDLVDWSFVAPCMAGPGVTTPPSGCEPDAFERADVDMDSDVDLRDVSHIVTSFK